MNLAVRLAIVGLTAKALAASCALGHSTDFILVKVVPGNGRVEVELTADYGGNPMFANKAEAQSVLSHVLDVRAEGQSHQLGELAPLRFEDRTQFDPTTPIPVDAPGEASPRQLLTAVWSWKQAAGELAFTMPEDTGQTVILWTPPEAPGKPPKWVFLLSGESSPGIKIPHRSYFAWAISAGVCFVGVVAAIRARHSTGHAAAARPLENIPAALRARAG